MRKQKQTKSKRRAAASRSKTKLRKTSRRSRKRLSKKRSKVLRRRLKLTKRKGSKRRLRRRRRHRRGRRAVIVRRPDPQPPKGVNIIGFIHAEIGIGESARLAARSLETVKIPFGTIDFPIPTPSNDLTWAHKAISGPVYNVNLFHVNADSLPTLRNVYGESFWHGRFNIGYWHWELPAMREEDLQAFAWVQEVWVPTTFVQEAVAKSSPGIPVVRIPHGIHVDIAPELQRDFYGLPNDRYLFLMSYDVQSYSKRKNPEGVVEAFNLAFDRNDDSVGLVLKLNNTTFDPEETAKLAQLIGDYKNIFVIDRTLSRLEVNTLIHLCDSYVSLHRAEGFGLGLAEAMFLGKPVIGTNYSGNTDFMHEDNACLVNYELIPVGSNLGVNDQIVYNQSQLWAQPDAGHAAYYMKKLVSDEAWRSQIAANGQHFIRTHYSPSVSGDMMRQRLMQLNLL